MKKTLTAITLAIVLMFGTTFANAGIIVIGKADSSCSKVAKDGIIVIGKAGIIVIGVRLVAEIKGLLMSDAKTSAPCKDKNGIIVIG